MGITFVGYFVTKDIFGYSDLCYSDTSLTVPVFVNPMLPKSVAESKYLLTMTLFIWPEGVTVTKDVCIRGRQN